MQFEKILVLYKNEIFWLQIVEIATHKLHHWGKITFMVMDIHCGVAINNILKVIVLYENYHD